MAFVIVIIKSDYLVFLRRLRTSLREFGRLMQSAVLAYSLSLGFQFTASPNRPCNPHF